MSAFLTLLVPGVGMGASPTEEEDPPVVSYTLDLIYTRSATLDLIYTRSATLDLIYTRSSTIDF